MHRFTADAAHELRTPLASLRTIGEVALQQEHDPDGQREALSSILEESERLAETIDSLLLLARAEALQLGEKTATFSIVHLVNEVLSVLEVVIEEQNVRVIRETETIGEIIVRGDRNLLRTAILNVVHNALKFSPGGSALTISCAFSDTNPPRLRLVIEDEGPGIVEDEFNQVFERFFTSTASETAYNSGTGLGLPVAKLVVERIGGIIGFERAARHGGALRHHAPGGQMISAMWGSRPKQTLEHAAHGLA